MVELKREVGPTSKVEEFVLVATFLPVRRWRDVIPFLRMTFTVIKQLKETQGIIRFGLRTDFMHKRFWTYTVWTSKAPLNSFVVAEPHATAVKKFDNWAGKGAAFVEWNSTDGSINWSEALKRLQTPTFYYSPPNK